MAKYLDKTRTEWEELTEKWHSDASITCSLQEYLELDDIEYLKFVNGIDDENISNEDVLKKSSEIARDVVVELAIKPQLFKMANYINDMYDEPEQE